MAFEQFHLLSGIVQIRYPDKMDVDDLRDFEETINLIVRSVKRRNTSKEAEPMRAVIDMGDSSNVLAHVPV